ncbi:hypothetical protein GGX14DRAFT_401115 [Mycena pura]|uniref:Uncharacterized protein n=1 Tax=Mycena pura TaxID=153505 RepID=A0AAD6V4V7_9AGAR|nr:hypothetical protein GGX14DRAFT_401115 [Mycena pura]
MGRAELVELARDLQKTVTEGEVELTNTRKRLRLAEITNAPGRGRPRKRARQRIDSDDEEEEGRGGCEGPTGEKRLRQAGNKFVICEGLWLSDDVAEVLKTNKDETYNEASRFTRARQHVPTSMLTDLSIPQIETGMTAQRSNTSSRLRNDCDAVFNKHLGERGPIDLHNDLQRKKCLDLIGGQIKSDDTVVYHHFNAPILHSDLSNTFNKDTFLRNMLVIHVAAAILFGPGKARALATGASERSTAQCLADILSIMHTTPGLIAGAAVLTLWTLSIDHELKKKGCQSSLNYKNLHKEYLNYLLVGVNKRKKPVLEIFKVWDAELFPDTETSLASALTGDGVGEGDLEKALAELDDAESVPLVDDGEGEGEGTVNGNDGDANEGNSADAGAGEGAGEGDAGAGSDAGWD